MPNPFSCAATREACGAQQVSTMLCMLGEPDRLVRRAHPPCPAILNRFALNRGLTTSDNRSAHSSPNQVLTHAARAAAEQLPLVAARGHQRWLKRALFLVSSTVLYRPSFLRIEIFHSARACAALILLTCIVGCSGHVRLDSSRWL